MSRYPGYYIDQVGKGAKGWVFVLTQGDAYRDQVYEISSKFPRDWVSDNWKRKLSITSVARSKGKWLIVMSRAETISKQAYRLASKFDPAWVRARADEGFVLTDVDSDKDYVLHTVTQFDARRIDALTLTSSSAPTREIREAWSKGFAVTSVGYLEAERKWAVGMAKVEARDQAFWEGPYLPTDWIKERWADGFSMTAIR